MDLVQVMIWASIAGGVLYLIWREYKIAKSDNLFWERISSMEDHFAPRGEDEMKPRWKRIETEEKTK